MTDKPDNPNIAAATITHNSNLRDRIAAALGTVEVVLDGWDYLNDTSRFLLADAVIRELQSLAEPSDGRDDQWLDADIYVANDAPGTPVAIEQDPGSVIYVTANYARKMAAALLLAADKSDWLRDESRWLRDETDA